MEKKEEKNLTQVIPENSTGKEIDATCSVELGNSEEAKKFFALVKQRLLTVNSWHEVAGIAAAEFQLTDSEGHEVNRIVKEGDRFRIDIPGPGSIAGRGYDWVEVEEVKIVEEGETESVGIRVRPTTNPESNSNEIAHFYSEDSTSNFTVTREGTKITAGIYDRNTKPNKDANLIDKARDMVVGLSAVAGFSRFQWEKLAKGLLRKGQ